MRVLITGAAGFIGYHLARRLLLSGRDVTGLDNLNDYYDVNLKRGRLRQLTALDGFRFEQRDLSDRAAVEDLFARERFDVVVNLAAQAGVRYSLTDPHVYVSSNLAGFVNLLEACRHGDVGHLVYASSSSVYGAVTKMPFSEHDDAAHPISLYGATKKANELLAHAYSHLFGVPTTGLRFFTVYGPWGRPDMAVYLFTRAILAGEPVVLFNNGDMQRDFTYVEDVVEVIDRLIDRPPRPDARWSGQDPDPATSAAPYRLYNVGNSRPEPLMRLLGALETSLGRKAVKRFVPMQPGDVYATFANVDDLSTDFQFAPHTPLEVGVERFVRWYLDFHHPEQPERRAASLQPAALQ